MDASMLLDVPADTTVSGEEFFRTEGAYTSLGAPIPGGRVGNWILREGSRIDNDVEMFDELCWRLVGDGLPLFRATLHMGTLHPQIRGVGARWLREQKVIEEYRILQGSEATDEYLRSPIRATVERGTPFRRRLTEDTPEYPLLTKLRNFGVTDYFALALNRTFRRYPVVTWATDRPGGFGDADIAVLEEINPALAAIIEPRAVRRITENLLDTYLGPQAGRCSPARSSGRKASSCGP
jgi:adenylate cyclase